MIKFIEYRLTLEEPAVINEIGGDPNSATTLSFIPGSAVRGCIAGKIGEPSNNPSIRNDFDKLILSGSVRFLNAYPLASAGRSLPTALCLRARKSIHGTREQRLINLASFSKNDLTTEADGEPLTEALKPVGDKFMEVFLTADPRQVHVRTRVAFHHQRDRKKGRAWTDQQGIPHGTVFSYEALEAGQTFSGFIAVQGLDDKAIEAVRKNLCTYLGVSPSLLLGRSRRAQYGGKAALTFPENAWHEREWTYRQNTIKGDLTADRLYLVLFTAPGILRDQETGQIDPTAYRSILPELFAGKVEITGEWTGFGICGGYNRKWGTSLPQTATLAAGSVVRIKPIATIQQAKWLEIEANGLGERRTEGFGTFVFIPMMEITEPTISLVPQEEPLPALPAQIPALVKEMQKKLLEEELKNKVRYFSIKLARKATQIPSNSLLGRLRLPLRTDGQNALRTIKTWMTDKNIRLKKTAKNQLERCHLNGVSLDDWLKDAVTKSPEEVLKDFSPFDIYTKYAMLPASDVKKIGEALLPEFRIMFIDTVIASLARKNRQKKGS